MDPAAREEAAHASARILLMRGRGQDPQLTERLVSFTDDYGIEMLAELWSHASAHSLPGALWRMYQLRDTVHRSPRGVSRAFELGMAEDYRSHVVAGVPDPPGAEEVVHTIDEILAGLYTGDLDMAMERCAAFARVVAVTYACRGRRRSWSNTRRTWRRWPPSGVPRELPSGIWRE